MKKPGWPSTMVVSALVMLNSGCNVLLAGPAGVSMGVVMRFQNSCSLSTRLFGALPALMAAFMAPMEMPATQLGWMFSSARAS